MKLLWKSGNEDVVIQNHRKQQGIETMTMQQGSFDHIRAALLQSKQILPPSMTSFNGWEVGMLQRFDITDLKNPITHP
jgi:hypothetical protein